MDKFEKTRGELIAEAASLGIAEELLANLSIHSLKKIVEYESEVAEYESEKVPQSRN